MCHWTGEKKCYSWCPKKGTAGEEGSSPRPSTWQEVGVQYNCHGHRRVFGSTEADSCLVPDAVRLTPPYHALSLVHIGGLCSISVLRRVLEHIIIFI